jgi:hypothetical protein
MLHDIIYYLSLDEICFELINKITAAHRVYIARQR